MSRKHIDIDWSVYAIIDAEWIRNRSLTELTESVISGGAGVIQYRDKVSDSREFYEQSTLIRQLTRKHHLPFIINDRLDIALAVRADGVHLGKSDLPAPIARSLLSPQQILGQSIGSPEELVHVENADYLGIGAIFPTETHRSYQVNGLDSLVAIRRECKLPLVAIGGINQNNCQAVIQAGADGIAVISAILGETEVEMATRMLVQKVQDCK